MNRKDRIFGAVFCVILAIIVALGVNAATNEADHKALEKRRAVQIVYRTCGEKYLDTFHDLYGDLSGPEQRKVADTWSIRCPKLVH